MRIRTDRARRLVALCLCLAAASAVSVLIAWQFRRLRDAVPLPEDARRAPRTPLPNKPKEPRVLGVRDVKLAESPVPDLDGVREPTVEELIRYAVIRYLNEVRGATPGNFEKVLNFPNVRAELEELLRNLPAEAVPIIAELLREESDSVCRRILIYGLADIGTDEAAAVLRQHFLDHIADQARGSEMRHVVWALGRCEAPAAYDALIEFLGGEGEAMRELRPHYVESLGTHRRGAEAVPIFLDLLRDDIHDGVRNKAAQAIKVVGKRDPGLARAAVAGLMDSYRTESARQGERVKEGAPPHPYVKQTTLGAIGQSGDPAAIPFLLEVGTTEGFDERLSAAAAISRIGGDQATAALREIYANISDQRKLLDAISQLNEPNALPFLQEIATTATSEEVRRTALAGISRVGGSEAIAALQAVLTAELPPSVRKDATSRLNRLTGGRGGT